MIDDNTANGLNEKLRTFQNELISVGALTQPGKQTGDREIFEKPIQLDPLGASLVPQPILNGCHDIFHRMTSR